MFASTGDCPYLVMPRPCNISIQVVSGKEPGYKVYTKGLIFLFKLIVLLFHTDDHYYTPIYI